MSTIQLSRYINAPREKVFETIAHIENFSAAIPGIIHSEIISETKKGVGTRFKETREMKGRQVTEELEIKEYTENERLRIVADSHGTLWDSVFILADEGNGCRLELTLTSTPRGMMAKMMNAVIQTEIEKALNSDMDSVKTYCEKKFG